MSTQKLQAGDTPAIGVEAMVDLCIGWTEGDGTGHEGYNAADYFNSRGQYKGPDEHGIEPIFRDLTDEEASHYTAIETQPVQFVHERPCTIFDGPWTLHGSHPGTPPHSVICTLYGGTRVINIHGPEWSYGHRWNDPTLFDELAEMIRQAPEVRKERDELSARVDELKAKVEGLEAEVMGGNL